MKDLSWLTERPIAHRGYHNDENGVIENTPTAVSKALERNFAIEVDLQETADHKALIFHDHTLNRVTHAKGEVAHRTLDELMKVKLKRTRDPMWSLQQLLEEVKGDVPLIIEVKSLFRNGGQREFLYEIVEALRHYNGPFALKSFDPKMLRALKDMAPHIPRGALSCSFLEKPQRDFYNPVQRFIIRYMLHMLGTKPDFISYCIRDLPAVGPSFLKRTRDVPVMAWTVKTPADREKAQIFADQIVFEGFDPDLPIM
ncbi:MULTISPECIES: glycerophosphodiester phosphodiesterase family protein [Pseudovibrio]|uniref:glycerophosphodiester phosphodiesterase family protein n=1 Tax=Stappiaceae TaxID=2821832 RepID=UPI00236538E2|nr:MULTISPECIES: glycerophosphodiester phosphodiesterase family protein [Pseudovibrio]MDD7910684.1 glycerophosphodiester phosphodiesterase family protein [Pseudovibrio exalbescens]MDX5594477.1 glycerophosphodiester phosphodiesterase family protein [Pseudovibrio sp. SPO723]